MSNWEEKPLICLADYINGYAFKPTDWEKEGVPIIRIEQINGGKPTDFHNGYIPEKNRIYNGDLIFSWSATLKVVIWNRGFGYLNQHLFKVIPKNNVEIFFLKHLLDFNMATLGNQSQGSTMKHVKRSELETFKTNIPNFYYQQKIAKILNTIDAVIDKTEQAIAKYQALKKGMMHDLFTRGIDLKTGKLRPNYEEAPELYKESKLGMIPKDWSVEPLSKLGVIKSGIDYKSNPKGNKFPIYGTGGIMGWTSLYLNSGPAVLTGRKGTINNPLFVEDKFWNVDTIFCINSINTKETDIKWLFYQFRNTDLTKLNEATGVPSVNSSALYKLLFKTPLFKEQEEIQFRITKIDTLIEKEKENLKKHQKIKKGLMQDLLTGKVEVKV